MPLMKKVSIPPGMHTHNKAYFEYVVSLHRGENPEMPIELQKVNQEELKVAVDQAIEAINHKQPLTYFPQSHLESPIVYDPFKVVQIEDIVIDTRTN